MDKEFFFVQYQSEGKLGRRPKKSMSCSLDPVLFVGNKKKSTERGRGWKKKEKEERNSGDVSAQIFRPCALEGLKS